MRFVSSNPNLKKTKNEMKFLKKQSKTGKFLKNLPSSPINTFTIPEETVALSSLEG